MYDVKLELLRRELVYVHSIPMYEDFRSAHLIFYVLSCTTHIQYIRVPLGETKIQRAQNFIRLAQDTAWLELGTS